MWFKYFQINQTFLTNEMFFSGSKLLLPIKVSTNLSSWNSSLSVNISQVDIRPEVIFIRNVWIFKENNTKAND